MVADGTTMMEQLFVTEVQERLADLASGILALAGNAAPDAHLKQLMRITHALKGAAGMLGYEAFVSVAHRFESRFESLSRCVPSQVAQSEIDLLLHVVDRLLVLYRCSPEELTKGDGAARSVIDAINGVLSGQVCEAVRRASDTPAPLSEPPPPEGAFVSVRSEVLEELIQRGAENLVTGKHLDSLAHQLKDWIDRVRRKNAGELSDADLGELVEHLQSKAAEVARLSDDLYDTVLRCKHRPFQDIALGLQRLSREVSGLLKKEVLVEVVGDHVLIDREILRIIDEPLGHIIRNAIDHGIEPPEMRIAAGKQAVGRIGVIVRPSLGWLRIEITDDGAGIDRTALRAAIERKGLSTKETLAQMSESELFAFLFLPGFTTRESATTVSGRGIGLDAVHSAVTALGGEIDVASVERRSTTFTLRVPLKRSLQSCLILAQGEAQYAIPVTRVAAVLDVQEHTIERVGDRRVMRWDGRMVPCAVFGMQTGQQSDFHAPRCVLVQDPDGLCGMLFNGAISYHDLSIQNLEPVLGKSAEVRGAAISDRGGVIPILETSWLLRRATTEVVSDSTDSTLGRTKTEAPKRKVLVVDDSLTVRELERKLLVDRGYDVTVASDGLEGWSVLRRGDIELVVTDVDMPRMNGFELVQNIRNHPQLRELPIVIVSYKERDEDRRKGLEVGADRYLTKGSFHDSTFADAIKELLA